MTLAFAFPFFLFSLAHVAGEFLKNRRVGDRIRYGTKPFLMPLLALYYLFSAIALDQRVSILILLALGGGWLGDLFLMIPDPEKTRKWFRPGLGAFLLGHIFYTAAFVRSALPLSDLNSISAALILFFLAYGLLAYRALSPFMGKLRLPITVYIAVIALMGISTALCLISQPWTPALIAILGALIFMISDTVNAWNRFARPIGGERIITMATYLAGQFLLIAGFLLFI